MAKSFSYLSMANMFKNPDLLKAAKNSLSEQEKFALENEIQPPEILYNYHLLNKKLEKHEVGSPEGFENSIEIYQTQGSLLAKSESESFARSHMKSQNIPLLFEAYGKVFQFSALFLSSFFLLLLSLPTRETRKSSSPSNFDLESTEGILISDQEGKILAYNPGIEAFLPLSSSSGSLNLRTFFQTFFDKNQKEVTEEENPIFKALSSQSFLKNQILGIKRSNEYYQWILLNSHPLEENTTNKAQIVLSLKDITRLVEARYQLDHFTEPLVALSHFSQFIPRSPIAKMKGISFFEKVLIFLGLEKRIESKKEKEKLNLGNLFEEIESQCLRKVQPLGLTLALPHQNLKSLYLEGDEELLIQSFSSFILSQIPGQSDQKEDWFRFESRQEVGTITISLLFVGKEKETSQAGSAFGLSQLKEAVEIHKGILSERPHPSGKKIEIALPLLREEIHLAA